jgi:predicted Zn-dependent protease with MMP-like domain
MRAFRGSWPGAFAARRRSANLGGVRPGDETRRRLRRDRHGRGLRGPLAPAGVPLARTRAQHFDDLVLDAVSRLDSRWEQQLASVEFAVEEVPPPGVDNGADGGDPVPLARLDPVAAGRPARIVVYRRPAQARAEGDDELAALVFDAVVEEVARLIGVDPETIDPGYDADD